MASTRKNASDAMLAGRQWFEQNRNNITADTIRGRVASYRKRWGSDAAEAFHLGVTQAQQDGSLSPEQRSVAEHLGVKFA